MSHVASGYHTDQHSIRMLISLRTRASLLLLYPQCLISVWNLVSTFNICIYFCRVFSATPTSVVSLALLYFSFTCPSPVITVCSLKEQPCFIQLYMPDIVDVPYMVIGRKFGEKREYSFFITDNYFFW